MSFLFDCLQVQSCFVCAFLLKDLCFFFQVQKNIEEQTHQHVDARSKARYIICETTVLSMVTS